MRDFNPHRIASEWHSGQGSALYSYASTDRIPTEDFKDRLVWEIEQSMAQADDEGLDELEMLLMHVEEQHPDQYPGSEMHEVEDVRDCIKSCQAKDKGRKMATFDPESVYEAADEGICYGCGKEDGHDGPCVPDYEEDEQVNEAWGTVDKDGNEEWYSADDDVDFDKCEKCDKKDCKCSSVNEADSMCEMCGGMKNEGTCECAMAEADREPSTYDYDDREMSLSQKRSAAAERSRKDARKSSYDDPNWKPTAESTLRTAIQHIVSEMKLSVAGPNPFGFGGAEEVTDDEVAHFLLTKKDASKDAPAPPKSGVKVKPKRKSKKVG